jgi:hypothetical protein
MPQSDMNAPASVRCTRWGHPQTPKPHALAEQSLGASPRLSQCVTEHLDECLTIVGVRLALIHLHQLFDLLLIVISAPP